MTDEMIAMDSFDEAFMHYGTLRKSGRYPWGSGDNGYQKHRDFLGDIQNYKKQGFSEIEIAKAMLGEYGTTAELRRLITNSRKIVRTETIDQVRKLSEKQMSNVAIAQRMGIPEATVRSYLKADADDRAEKFNTVKDFLKERTNETGYIDVGAGTELYMGISDTRKKAILGALDDEGYVTHTIKVPQAGTDKETTYRILTKPGTEYKDVWANIDKIEPPMGYSEDHGKTILPIKPPVPIDSKRVGVRYAEEGGANKDGVIELRRGVDDISLGNSRYAQVRISVDGTHYLKGMAMYSDNMPDGVDIMFNTNKSNTGNKFDAMKSLKRNKETGEIDEDMPFGSIVRQKEYTDSKTGKTRQSVLNIVGTYKKDDDGNDISSSGEEGGWNQWSKNFSSQMLSKQSVPLAKQQLDLTYRTKFDEFDEISKLTNPEVKKKMLMEFAEGVDSSSVHLKAAGLPRTRAQVILPINSLRDDEIYAPNFKSGETVVLVRHPHGGTFEIPQLKVNNNNKEARSIIPQAQDAVGINSRVAARLSGADFDGDTVLVIPNNQGRIKSSSPLAGLKDFDPQKAYSGYSGMRTIDGGTYNAETKKVDYGGKSPDKGAKQLEMGKISNLITDMTLRGANHNEISRAVRHSMVVIDAEKHSLDYRRSFKDNNIAELKARYQGKSDGGASTIISRAKSTARPNERKEGRIDPTTGEKTYIYTDRKYKEVKDPSTGKKTRIYSDNEAYDSTPGKVKYVRAKAKSTKMAETNDARSLISEANTPMENVYANHANKLKALANQARKEALAIKPEKQNASAKATYSKEIESLKAKLRIAQMNAPLERKAQVIADTIVKQKVQSNPDMDNSELKKVKALALDAGRARAGANKQRIVFNDSEWAAIQARALSSNTISQILQHANADDVKARATPRTRTVMTDSKMRLAKAMLASGHNQSDIAERLGVPLSTLYDAIN